MVVPTITSPFNLPGRFQVTPGRQQHAVAIHQLARRAGKNGAVRVAVERHAQRSACVHDVLCNSSGCSEPHPALMLRPSGESLMRGHVCAQRPEKLRRELARRAIGAIEHDFHPRQLRARKNGAAQSSQIVLVQLFVAVRGASSFSADTLPFFERITCFERGLNGIRKFHARRRNQLYAIVVIGIVRGGNHHAGGESLAVYEPGHSRRREHARGHRLRAGGRPAPAQCTRRCADRIRACRGRSERCGSAACSRRCFPSASPTRSSVASSSGYSPGIPRIPSVPNSCFPIPHACRISGLEACDNFSTPPPADSRSAYR